MKGDEKEFTSDVGERATTGKSQHVQAEVHAEYQMGVEGDLVHLLYDLNLCLPCELGNEGVKQGTQKFQEAESCFFHSDSGTVHPKAIPRTIDSVVQQVIKVKTRPGREYRLKGTGKPGREAEAGEWMMEEQLVALQMNDVTIGVTIDECMNLGSDEECALVDGY